jgi:death-on-curing protein
MKDVIYITLDEVYTIHERMIKIGGGRAMVRDFTLLHSAVERPKVMFGGNDLYPTLWLKAAALLQSLVMNHPFTDGNKRTGFFSTMFFIRRNGYGMEVTRKDIVGFSLHIDNGNPSLEDIAQWLEKHARKMEE